MYHTLQTILWREKKTKKKNVQTQSLHVAVKFIPLMSKGVFPLLVRFPSFYLSPSGILSYL